MAMIASPMAARAVRCPCVSAAWHWAMVALMAADTLFLPRGRRSTGAKEVARVYVYTRASRMHRQRFGSAVKPFSTPQSQ
jgi:hypothetical protein